MHIKENNIFNWLVWLKSHSETVTNHCSYYKFVCLTVLYDNFIHTCGLINRPLSINGFTEVRHQVVSSRKKLNYALHYIKIGEHLNKITSNFTLQIPLGTIFKNENVNEDIISILQQFHSYLHKAADGGVDGQLFSGDQLTVERAFLRYLFGGKWWQACYSETFQCM